MDLSRILIHIPKFLLRMKIRGGTRLMLAMARRIGGLQSYWIEIGGRRLYVDLRNAGTHAILMRADTPSEEKVLLERCVRAGDIVYDIGANAGLFTIWLSRLVGSRGKVFSFEPNPAHKTGLEKTAAEAGNICFFPLGLADEKGSFELFVPEDDTMSSLNNWTNGEGGKVSKTTCEVTTIDSLVEEGVIDHPAFIKCDIEGGELDCFKGAQAMLDRADAPVMLFEANINCSKGYGRSILSAYDFLASLGAPAYSFFLLKADAKLEPISGIAFDHGNILAVPSARMDEMGLL
ncbi:MAG: FkbM family methyltransferase [Pyrinomonadaceae bacterium]